MIIVRGRVVQAGQERCGTRAIHVHSFEVMWYLSDADAYADLERRDLVGNDDELRRAHSTA
jgi:hypothetical protein